MSEPDSNPLPSWQDGPAKKAIVSFVERVSGQGSPDYVPIAERIATLDNDGTLWAEQPLYVQGFFALDQIRALAPQHSEWLEEQPFRAVLENDKKALEGLDRSQIVSLVLAAHAGMGQEEFIRTAREWLARARHPRFKVPCTELVYLPMLELLDHLRAHQFKVFIVSGGGIDFVRAFSEEIYGVPRENVIGSSLDYEFGPGQRLTRIARLGKFDEAEGKPESIALHVGRRPILVAGNSDGDLAMMRYAAAGSRPFLNILLHHDDALREWAYDRESRVGMLGEALDEAIAKGWTVVSMKRDWKRIFRFED